MINPCVVIATDQRMPITTVNIKLLMAQGVKVVLVVSDTREKSYYENFDIHVVFHSNNPLGAKWQAGVDYARQFDPSHIVITGSDDLLSTGFFKKYCNEFVIGFWAWYVWNNNKLFHLQYLPLQPLGGGRVYPASVLNTIDWKIFDIKKEKCLDDHAWKVLHGQYLKTVKPEILAVKGNWAVMNPVDLKHKNIKLLATYEGQEALEIMKEKFNYDPKGIL